MTATAPAPDPIDGLLTPEAVRTRCGEILHVGLGIGLPWFDIDLSKLEDAVSRVVAEIETNYPDGDVPFHSRWRHFELGGTDLWADIAASHALSGDDLAIVAGDLAIVSVLLDAGAGPDWIYTDDATGLRLGRSEGLALASLRLFESGILSADDSDLLRADASALSSLSGEKLGRIFQVTDDNPLVGLEQRAGLLRKLGNAIRKNPSLYMRDDTVRPGNLIPALAARGDLQARDILVALLDTLMDIWPSPVRIDGHPLGDVGRHNALVRSDATNMIVPFHKLSQWLSYSLIEPLQQSGRTVSDLDGLTGLAEYRNGGLFVDTGVLTLKDNAVMAAAHSPSSEVIVEWRALTVALLDRLAEGVRTSLGKSATDLPLASILQGGTWTAGRKIAAELRPDGGPPIRLDSDATVF
ncbi:MAG: DUF1688 family protein [Alphaproteobacteria bacterium]